MHQTPQQIKTQARIAGWLYLVIALGAGFGYGYTQGTLHIAGDALQTWTNLEQAGGLFRFAIIASILGFMCDIAVSAIFYFLLKPTNQILSLMAAFFRVTQTAILGLNMLALVIVTLLLSGSLNSFSLEQVQDITSLLLQAHDAGFDIAMFFFGMHCSLLSYLFWKSDLFPKWLAGLVAFAGASYLFDSIIALGLPQFAGSTEPIVITASILGEFTLIFWLILKGTK